MNTASIVAAIILFLISSAGWILWVSRSEKASGLTRVLKIVVSVIVIFWIGVFLLPILFLPALGVLNALLLMGAAAVFVGLVIATRGFIFLFPFP